METYLCNDCCYASLLHQVWWLLMEVIWAELWQYNEMRLNLVYLLPIQSVTYDQWAHNQSSRTALDRRHCPVKISPVQYITPCHWTDCPVWFVWYFLLNVNLVQVQEAWSNNKFNITGPDVQWYANPFREDCTTTLGICYCLYSTNNWLTISNDYLTCGLNWPSTPCLQCNELLPLVVISTIG